MKGQAVVLVVIILTLASFAASITKCSRLKQEYERDHREYTLSETVTFPKQEVKPASSDPLPKSVYGEGMDK